MTIPQPIKKLLPKKVVLEIKSTRKKVRRTIMKFRIMRHGISTKGMLAQDLRLLGLGHGQDVMIHSSFSAIGQVEGGPLAVIHAVRDVVGPQANILMPSFPLKSTMLESMKNPAPFDVKKEPSRMGILTEIFRQLPDVKRSGHPTHAVSAQGPDAELYTATHHLSVTPCGAGSPFRILAERNGMILCIGCGIGIVTANHDVEDLTPEYPLEVYLPVAFEKETIFADGTRSRNRFLVHDPKLTPLRADNLPRIERRSLRELRKRGIVREGKVGLAGSFLFRLRDSDQMYLDLLKEGITQYDTGRNM